MISKESSALACKLPNSIYLSGGSVLQPMRSAGGTLGESASSSVSDYCLLSDSMDSSYRPLTSGSSESSLVTHNQILEEFSIDSNLRLERISVDDKDGNLAERMLTVHLQQQIDVLLGAKMKSVTDIAASTEDSVQPNPKPEEIFTDKAERLDA